MLKGRVGDDIDFRIFSQRRPNMMAVAHVDDDENATAWITSRCIQYTLGEVNGMGVPGMTGPLAGQPRDGIVEFVPHMMPPALIDGRWIRRSTLQQYQSLPE